MRISGCPERILGFETVLAGRVMLEVRPNGVKMPLKVVKGPKKCSPGPLGHGVFT
jgi:hypothetical protein